MVCGHRTKLGAPTSMTQNPHNAIIHLGHSNGTVTLWSPNMSTPLVKMFTHHGPVRSLAIDREGRYMVSAGADYRVKIWDVRNYREVHSYFTQRPADEVRISELGLLVIGWGGHVNVYPHIFMLILDLERRTTDKAAIAVPDSPHPLLHRIISPILSFRRYSRRWSLHRFHFPHCSGRRRTQL